MCTTEKEGKYNLTWYNILPQKRLCYNWKKQSSYNLFLLFKFQNYNSVRVTQILFWFVLMINKKSKLSIHIVPSHIEKKHVLIMNIPRM